MFCLHITDVCACAEKCTAIASLSNHQLLSQTILKKFFRLHGTRIILVYNINENQNKKLVKTRYNNLPTVSPK